MLFPVILVCLGVFAQDWVQERDRLLDQVEKKIESEIAKRVKPDLLAKSNGLPWPIKDPLLPLVTVYETASTQSVADTAAAFPPSMDQDLVQRVAKDYALFKVGDVITFKTNVKFSSTITGKLHLITPARIRVGSRWIIVNDLDDDVWPRFFPEECQKLQEKKLRYARHKLHLDREQYKKKKYQEKLLLLLKDNYYTSVNKDTSYGKYLEVENWMSMKDYFSKKLQEAEESVDEEIRDGITREYMVARNYVYNETEEEWEPKNWATQKNEAVPQKNEEPGFFQKLKGLF